MANDKYILEPYTFTLKPQITHIIPLIRFWHYEIFGYKWRVTFEKIIEEMGFVTQNTVAIREMAE